MQFSRMSSRRHPCGFTLLELLCALAVIAILATLAAPLAGGFRSRSQGLQCAANLKGLGAGVSAYMNEHNNMWPQIVTADSADSLPSSGRKDEITAGKWIAALAPYGVTDTTWRCPTIEGRIKSKGTPEALITKRIDYVPTQFSEDPGSASQWPSHPWFIERAPSHGQGPKLLQANGRVVSMEDLLKELPQR